MSAPTVVDLKEFDLSTNSSGKCDEEEEQPISQFAVQLELDVKPYTGEAMDSKIGLLAQFRLIFDQFYPFKAPIVKYINNKGLDTEQFNEILDQVN